MLIKLKKNCELLLLLVDLIQLHFLKINEYSNSTVEFYETHNFYNRKLV